RNLGQPDPAKPPGVAVRPAAVARPPAAPVPRKAPQRSPAPTTPGPLRPSTAATPAAKRVIRPAAPVEVAPPPWVSDAPEDEPVSPVQARAARGAARRPPHPADASARSTRLIEWLTGYLKEPARSRLREYLVL